MLAQCRLQNRDAQIIEYLLAIDINEAGYEQLEYKLLNSYLQ
jgi:hypothetical protein